MGISEERINSNSIAHQFKNTKIYSLLINLLNESGGEVYFGTLTSAVHDWLVEDPAPYRSEVKFIVKNIYGWIMKLDSEITLLSVDRPRHSERIKFKKN